MKKLLDYINSLPVVEQEALGKRCGTTIGYLRQIAYGHRPCSAELAINIERETRQAVMCEELCPDVDWAYIRSNRRSGRERRTHKDRRDKGNSLPN